MNLPTATAVGFAVSGGQPTDARSWISVDFDGHLSPLKRGYFVATEPTEHTFRGIELAAQVREIILNDLRRQHQVPVDIALGRAFARANGFVHGENTTGEHASFDRRLFIGATAVVIDDHAMTIAHVPPGQLVMIEDGLVYAVPELESWLPTYQGHTMSALGAPDPLGYSAQVRPHLAVTELRPGDVFALTNGRCGEMFAQQIATAGSHPGQMSGLFGRDPELVLDVFRNVVIENGLEDASVAVLALPPLPGSLQIQTIADVGRRVRDEWRHSKAFVREWTPSVGGRPAQNPFSSQPMTQGSISGGALKPMIEIPEYSISSGTFEAAAGLPANLSDGLRARPDVARAERQSGIQQRLLKLTERGNPKWITTWRQPSEMHKFGVPGAHGVQIFRGGSSPMGEPRWKTRLPRMPMLSVGLLWIFIVAVLASAVIGAAYLIEQREEAPRDYSAEIASIDQQIVDALAISDPEAKVSSLDEAQELVVEARDNGAPEELLRLREVKISEEKDVLQGVIRVSDVQRIGSLPDDLQENSWQIVQTSVGTFVVGGSLYQFVPETASLVKVLGEGEVIDFAPVESLFGIAADANGIYVTDGRHLFVRDLNGTWMATELKELSTFGAWSSGPIDAFGGSVYLLQQEYLDIYKFASNPENGVATGESWVNEGARGDLDSAIDIAIDGNILVLLDDGTIRTYRLSELIDEQTPEYATDDEPVAILNGASTGYIYVAVSTDKGSAGHVLAYDPVGLTTYRLELPIDLDLGEDRVTGPFEEFKDIAVDETTGTMYVVNGDSIWSMRYTLPVLQHMIDQNATPEAGS